MDIKSSAPLKAVFEEIPVLMQAWCHAAVTLTFTKLRQEDQEFRATLCSCISSFSETKIKHHDQKQLKENKGVYFGFCFQRDTGASCLEGVSWE